MESKSPFLTYVGIYISFFVGFILSTIPWSIDYIAFKPYWVLILLLQWSCREPKKVLYITALILGILMDSVTSSHLGQHAIGYLICTFLNRRLYPTATGRSLIYYFLIITLIFFVYSLTQAGLEFFSYNLIPFDSTFWGPIVSSSIVWIWFDFAFNYLRTFSGNKSKWG